MRGKVTGRGVVGFSGRGRGLGFRRRQKWAVGAGGTGDFNGKGGIHVAGIGVAGEVNLGFSVGCGV